MLDIVSNHILDLDRPMSVGVEDHAERVGGDVNFMITGVDEKYVIKVEMAGWFGGKARVRRRFDCYRVGGCRGAATEGEGDRVNSMEIT